MNAEQCREVARELVRELRGTPEAPSVDAQVAESLIALIRGVIREEVRESAMRQKR